MDTRDKYIVAGIFVFVVLLMTFFSAVEQIHNERNKAIEFGYARYNPTNSNFEYIHPTEFLKNNR